MNEPTAQGGAGSGNATLILVFGILGIVCCPLLAPVAWFMGSKELQGIAAGSIVASNEGAAKAGKILGIIGTILILLWLVWILMFGGLAVLGAIAES